MEETGVKRKVAVILGADVEDYSRSMGVNEGSTPNSHSACHEIVVGPIGRQQCSVVWTASYSVSALRLIASSSRRDTRSFFHIPTSRGRNDGGSNSSPKGSAKSSCRPRSVSLPLDVICFL